MKALQLTPDDNVGTALETLSAGSEVEVILAGETCGKITTTEEIPYGFKVCTKAMNKGDAVIKYSHIIGRASKDVAAGALVHVHNIEGTRGRGDLV